MSGYGFGSGHVQDRLTGLNQLLAHFDPEPLRFLRHDQLVVVVLGHGKIGLGDDHGDQIDQLAEPRPRGVHFLQAFQIIRIGSGETRPDTEPRGKMRSGLGPSERPRNGSQALDSSLGIPLGGSASDVEALQLELWRRLSEVRDEARFLSHQMPVILARNVADAFHLPSPILRRFHALGELLSQHGGRVDVQGVLGDRFASVILGDHLSLLRDAESTVDGVRRMRQDGAIEGGVAPATDGPTLAVKETDLDAGGVGDFDHAFLRQVLGPASGQTSGVFGAIGISNHNLLLSVNSSDVCRDTEQSLESFWGIVQIVQSFEKRSNSHHVAIWRCHTELLLQQHDRQDIRCRLALRDNVGSQSFRFELGGGLKHLKRLGDTGVKIHALKSFARKQGASIRQLRG
mmetsp:Transcript_17680/g.40780  ORF Transcript_17680/g.40780 Transcript_17680/m.40780 type:complete len:401 (+) Transcript_17680:435-1637(+)